MFMLFKDTDPRIQKEKAQKFIIPVRRNLKTSRTSTFTMMIHLAGLAFFGVHVDTNAHAQELLPKQLTCIRDLNLNNAFTILTKLALGNSGRVHCCRPSTWLTYVHFVRITKQEVSLPQCCWGSVSKHAISLHLAEFQSSKRVPIFHGLSCE